MVVTAGIYIHSTMILRWKRALWPYLSLVVGFDLADCVFCERVLMFGRKYLMDSMSAEFLINGALMLLVSKFKPTEL
jgi:hypothetical protein